MVDVQEIVDEIQSFLRSDDQTFREGLRVLATGYREACVAADRRLKQSNRLLAQGLRAEALHEADGDPKLLELLTLLDFPERQDWEDIVATYGLDAAPRIDPGLATALIEAYGEADPLADLLRQHRLLALSRAGLASRIAVLSKISELDPNNGIWDEDLRSYEKARQRDIGSEAVTASRQRDSATLARLVGELRNTPWRELPAESVVQSVTNAERKARRDAARDELVRIGATLHDAHAALDVGLGGLARQQWEQQARIARLDARDPILGGAAPALIWLEEHDARERAEGEYRHALASLEAALDDDIERHELERLGAAVLRFEKGLPELVERRYRTRLGDLDLTATRKRYLVFGVVAVCIATLGGLGVFLAMQASYDREVAAAIAALGPLIDGGQLPEAQKYLDTIQSGQPSIARSSQLQGLAATLRIKQSEEQDRKRELEACFDAAASAPIGPEEPAALVKARQLLRTEEDKSRFFRLTETRRRRHERQVAEVDKGLAGRVEALSNRVGELERAVSGHASADELLREVSQAVNAIGVDAQSASVRLQGLVATLRSRVTRASEAILDFKRQIASETRITAALRADAQSPLSDLNPYVAELTSFVNSFPQSRRSKDFDAVLVQGALWKSAVEWGGLVRRWQSRGHVLPNTPRDAQVLATELEEYFKDHAAGPDLEPARRLAEVAARTSKWPELNRELLTYIQSPIMTLWMLELKGTRYYVQDDANLSNVRLEVQQVRSGSKQSAYRENQLMTPIPMSYVVSRQMNPRAFRPLPKKSDLLAMRPSPQSVVMKAAVERLQKPSSPEEWERPLIALLDEVRQDFKIDPILKVEILYRLLSLACKGDLLLEEQSRETLKGLKDYYQEDAAWMDPQDFKSQAAREESLKALSRIVSFSDLAQRAGRVRAELGQQLLITREPIGWLCREEGGWTVRAESVPERLREANLLVVEPGGEGRSPKWTKVGQVENGRPILKQNPFIGPAEGRPVFAATGAPGDR